MAALWETDLELSVRRSIRYLKDNILLNRTLQWTSCSLYELSVCLWRGTDFTTCWLKLLTFIVSPDCFLNAPLNILILNTSFITYYYVYNKSDVSTWLCVNDSLTTKNWRKNNIITNNTKKYPQDSCKLMWCYECYIQLTNKTTTGNVLIIQQGSSQRRC